MKPAKKKSSFTIDAKKFNKYGKAITGVGAASITTGTALGAINMMRGRKFGKPAIKTIAGGLAGVITGTAMRAYSAKGYKQIKKGSKRK